MDKIAAFGVVHVLWEVNVFITLCGITYVEYVADTGHGVGAVHYLPEYYAVTCLRCVARGGSHAHRTTS